LDRQLGTHLVDAACVRDSARSAGARPGPRGFHADGLATQAKQAVRSGVTQGRVSTPKIFDTSGPKRGSHTVSTG
jgi:hypothetical protein